MAKVKRINWVILEQDLQSQFTVNNQYHLASLLFLSGVVHSKAALYTEAFLISVSTIDWFALRHLLSSVTACWTVAVVCLFHCWLYISVYLCPTDFSLCLFSLCANSLHSNPARPGTHTSVFCSLMTMSLFSSVTHHVLWQCCWPNCTELTACKTFGIRSVVLTVTDSRWRHFYFCINSVSSTLEVFTRMRYTNLHLTFDTSR